MANKLKYEHAMKLIEIRRQRVKERLSELKASAEEVSVVEMMKWDEVAERMGNGPCPERKMSIEAAKARSMVLREDLMRERALKAAEAFRVQ